ncbi:MAG: hypothetical protein Q8R28_21650, partial [Dehalococcoidia bacterium]|nr:hypothetical protein [Dehalococcoidia bacterium]
MALPKKSAESAEKVLLDVALESAIPPEILGAQSRARGSRGKGRKAARKKGPASEEPAGFGPIEGAAPPLPPSPSPPEGPNLLPGVSPLNKAERIRSTGELLRGKIDLPQFGGYADRAGAVEGTAKSFAAARRKHNALLDETFGENPTERLGKMARWLEDNPEGAQIPMKMREAPGSLTPAETALSRSPEFDKAGWQSFYRSLNRTRVQGLDEGWLGGDRGPNYFPRQVESVGHLLEVLGPDWRKKLLTPEGRALVLGNLQRSRLGDLVGDANAGVIAANYIRQVAEADTVQPWSKHFVETIK